MISSLSSKIKDQFNLDFKKIFLNKWFLAILVFKILLSFFFAADVVSQGFIPFINYYIDSGFSGSPYEIFPKLINPKAFPYPPLMFWLLSPLLLILSFFSNIDSFLGLFVLRLPIIFADILVYVILCKLLETKEDKVLWFYWASPILIFINYFHGQLDAIPTAALLTALFFLFKDKFKTAFIILGLGMAIKTHLLAALPLFAVYLYIKKISPLKIILLSLSSLFTTLIFVFPYLNNAGYINMVIKAEEQNRLFLLNFPYGFEHIKFYFAPGLYLILLFRFASYRKINHDLFMVIMALIFSVLVILVPPMPGWFYWSIPFLAYFYIKQSGAPNINFWILNLAYILYFIFQENSSVMQSFQFISPSLAQLQTPYDYLNSIGLPAEKISNLLFTGLSASMALNLIWCYKAGIKSNRFYKNKAKPILIGIAGDSGSGKTTFGISLKKIFSAANCIEIQGDDVHKWPRGHKNWELLTHLNPKSNNLHLEINHALELKDGDCIQRPHYDHSTGKFTEPVTIESNRFVLFSGLHTLYLKRLRDILDIKIFLEPDESLRTHWKIVRDIKERGYSKEKVMQQLEKRANDSNKFIKPQREKADLIFSYLPAKKIENMGSLKEKVKIKLRIYCENSLYIEPLIEEFCHSDLKIRYWHESDLNTQCVEFSGKVTAEEIKKAAYNLVPNLQELLYNNEPEFEKGYRGIRQLFVLYYLSEISRYKRSPDEE